MTVELRWLGWGSLADPAEKAPGTEASKASKGTFEAFEAPTPAQIQNIPILEAAPAAYQGAFDMWIMERCVFRDRTWGGVSTLHKDYAHWCTAQNRDVPAGFATFAMLLREVGSEMRDTALVYGIILREDAEYRDTLLAK